MNDHFPDSPLKETLMDAIAQGHFIRFLVVALAAGFLAITFLQSGLDKVFDFKGNLEFMKEQFSKTFLRNLISVFLPVLTIFEVATGFCLAFGIIYWFAREDDRFLLLGFLLSGITLLMLLFGQRISKQYAGAVSLTGYFIITLIGLLVMSYYVS